MGIFLKFAQTVRSLALIPRRLDELKINQGRILAEMNRTVRRRTIAEHGFKIFSQWDEDGIIQYLVSQLSIRNRTFIEFGVEDFTESNCRFLMMKDNWAGFVIDGSQRNIKKLRDSYFYWQYQLCGRASFITRENIGTLLEESGFEKDPGILSVDIDGVDYHVLLALTDWRPSVLIVEYNGVFGRTRPVTVPYDPGFQRTLAHHSNLYYGANLPAFMHLAAKRGYSLVGVNSVGSNAFFVRDDLLSTTVPGVALVDCYRDSSFREGRDSRGRLTFESGRSRRAQIATLPLLDVASGVLLTVADLTDC